MLTKNDIVLITGGTGFTGTVLVKKICEMGCRVRVIARASSRREAFKNLNIQWFEGEVYDEATLELL